MIRLGYHPATYVRQEIDPDTAIRDIAASGWSGFEWSPGTLRHAYEDPDAYARYLGEIGLGISGIYCSCSFADDAAIADWRSTVDATIDFCGAIGCGYIMFDGGSTTLQRDADTIQSIAAEANRMGQRIVDAGLICTWHQHWGTIFEYAAQFDALMAATDPDIIKCTPDTAQLALGDFDIPATFEMYLDRMHYVHFKDLDAERRFIELGHGIVDFSPLAGMLQEGGFDGWVVTDLDYTSLDPRESSRHNLRYLREDLGFAAFEA